MLGWQGVGILGAYARYGERRWDPEQFFRSGETEIADILEYAGDRGQGINPGKALDFGCGVGRLTQALCSHFDQVLGVDIAPSMIDLARKFNQYGSRCDYLLNAADHLDLFPEDHFDFICSMQVLQHMKPDLMRSYIRGYIRALARVFQLPSH